MFRHAPIGNSLGWSLAVLGLGVAYLSVMAPLPASRWYALLPVCGLAPLAVLETGGIGSLLPYSYAPAADTVGRLMALAASASALWTAAVCGPAVTLPLLGRRQAISDDDDGAEAD